MSETNQSLLNQVRSRDVGTLATLQSATGAHVVSSEDNDKYETTDERELRAYIESVSGVPTTGIGDAVFDENDLDSFRIGL